MSEVKHQESYHTSKSHLKIPKPNIAINIMYCREPLRSLYFGGCVTHCWTVLLHFSRDEPDKEREELQSVGYF